MMKQPQLNIAYYGPSVPPPKKAYRRLGRGGSSHNNLFTWCCNCNCIFRIVFAIVLALGIIGFVTWLVFWPNEVKFYAADTSLTQFEIINNTLHYDLALNITVRNPNKRVGVYYDSIEARAFYGGRRFASTQLDMFYQGHMNTTLLHTEFHGQILLLLGSNQIDKYEQEKSSGIYRVDVNLYLRMRFKSWWFKSPEIKPRVDCGLTIPLNSTRQSTRCRMHR